jgi:23S rRNA (guanosine2251-2'-O)-methyltransferase
LRAAAVAPEMAPLCPSDTQEKMTSTNGDSPEYLARKQFFQRMLTVYGRNPVAEALLSKDVRPYRLHLAESNKPAPVLQEIERRAREKGAEVQYHSREALAHISKNARQDQGVALDVECEGFAAAGDFISSAPEHYELLALDRITNPQNLGMIIRSVCASPMTGLLLPDKGCAKLDSLVIKASAGTLFKARILRCKSLADCLADFRKIGADVYGLDARGDVRLHQLRTPAPRIFVMGNESDGLSRAVAAACNHTIAIPMQNGVESLNVSIAASLIAFRTLI